jgi:hypothetical protein
MNWEARSIYADEFKKESEELIREIVSGALDESPNKQERNSCDPSISSIES